VTGCRPAWGSSQQLQDRNIYIYRDPSKNLLLLRVHSVHALGELLGLVVVRELGLHPDEIRKRSIGDRTVDGTLSATLVAVVALTRTRGIPVPVDVNAGDALGDGASLRVALALRGLQVLVDEFLLVGVRAGVDGVDDSIVEPLQTGLRNPLVLNGLERISGLSRLLSSDHQVVQGLQVRVGRADDERVVSVVNGRGDQSGGLRVSTGNAEEIGA